MDRLLLLEHLRRTRFAPGDRARARRDARRIAAFLRQRGAERVVGFGSAFLPEEEKRFTTRSDLDLAVEGLPPRHFFTTLARAQRLTDFQLDLVPLESATAFLRKTVREEGVPL